MSNNEQDDSSMVCNACNYKITSFNDRMQHYKTEWHRYNVKRRCAGLDSITSDAFELKLSALRNSKQSTIIKCQACSKTFKTTTSHDQHMQSNKHKKQQAKYEAALKAGVVMTADTQPATEDVDETMDEKQEDENMPQAESKRAQGAAAAPGDETVVEDGDEEEEEEGEGIPLKQCLFCNEMFDEFQQSLDHMLKDHGFFIPFSELLHDLEGLMSYLGEKVGIGHVCLYCNGRGRARFPNTRAVQQHMMSKDHCKIRFEDDPDDEEFLDFYDFPQEEEDTEDAESDNAKPDGSESNSADQDNSNSKPAPRRKLNKVSGISEGGELILSNGTRIGHRSLNVYYKQNLRPTASTALVVPAEMSQAAQHAATDATGRRALQVIVAGGGKSQALLAMQDKYRVAALVKEHRATEVDRTRFVQRLQQRRMQIGVKANNFRFHLRAQINM